VVIMHYNPLFYVFLELPLENVESPKLVKIVS